MMRLTEVQRRCQAKVKKRWQEEAERKKLESHRGMDAKIERMEEAELDPYTGAAERIRAGANEIDDEKKIGYQDIPPSPPAPDLQAGTAGANGWYISDVIVEAAYSDPNPSSGLTVNITTDGTNWGAYTAPLTLPEGVYSITARHLH